VISSIPERSFGIEVLSVTAAPAGAAVTVSGPVVT